MVLMWKWLNQWINDVPLNSFILVVVFCCQPWHVLYVMGSAAEFHFTPFIKKSSLNLTQCRFSTLNIFFLYLFFWFFYEIYVMVNNKVRDISQLSVTVSSWVRHYRSSSSGKLQSFDIKPHFFATPPSCKMQNKLLKDIKTEGKNIIKKYKCTFELILVHSIVLSLSPTVHNLLLFLKEYRRDMR